MFNLRYFFWFIFQLHLFQNETLELTGTLEHTTIGQNQIWTETKLTVTIILLWVFIDYDLCDIDCVFQLLKDNLQGDQVRMDRVDKNHIEWEFKLVIEFYYPWSPTGKHQLMSVLPWSASLASMADVRLLNPWAYQLDLPAGSKFQSLSYVSFIMSKEEARR